LSTPPSPETRAALPAAASRSEAIRYGAYMLRRFGWFYRVLGLGRMLGHLRLEDHSVERIRTAASRGPVVYILLEQSSLDHLALNTVLNKRRLPLSVWANGVTAFFWQPVVEAWRDVGRRVRALFSRGLPPAPVGSGWLTRTIAGGAPVTLFLDSKRRFPGWPSEAETDPIPAVLQAQERSEKPIQLLPVVVVWNRSPEVRGGVVRTFITGGRVGRGRLNRIRDLLFHNREAFVQVGDSVDVRAFCERVEEWGRPRALRTLLRRYLRREAILVRGPRLLPYRDMRRLVLDNPPMRALIAREAEVTGQSVEQIRTEMERVYKQIAARFRWWVIRVLDVVLQPLWTRVFSGVDIREEDLERIRSAMREGSAVLAPSHKSHFDYLLLSWAFYSHDLIVPHVVAGLNLAVWPVSIILRGAGGFFIKRTFVGDRVFPAVFSRYLRELLRHGYPVEFFVEGGRTRSGKLLPPRLGVLGMVMDAASVRPTGQEVTLLPVSFAYEQVAESAEYARELSGERKKPETLAQMVRASKVFRNRYGRAYVRVGEPVRCSEIVDGDDHRPSWNERDARARKEVLERVGECLIHRIGRATVVLPTSLVALAMMAHHRRGIRHEELLERADRFRIFLAHHRAPEAASLGHWTQAISEALAKLHRGKLLESFDAPDGRVWAVPVDHRITLEFYKNQILHFFVLAGYAAIAARTLPDGPFTAEDLRTGFCDLVWLFRREFALDPNLSASTQLRQGLDALAAHGALRPLEGNEPAWEVSDPLRMGEIYGLFRNFLEAYAIVLRHAEAHLRRHPGRRDLAQALQGDQQAWVASGEVTRPEALSMVTLVNAVASYEEDGVLVRARNGGLALDPKQQERRLRTLAPIFE
jgi:glycerol-3-phosphate O-acyltransferase